MKKTISLTIAALLLLCLFVGCSSSNVNQTSNTPAQDGQASSETITVGVALSSLNSKFFEAELYAISKYCEEQGINYIPVVADGDATKQKTQIEDLISQGVDAMIIVQQDKDAIVSSLEDCKKAGIYTICMGRMPADLVNMDVGIYCDNDDCARVAVDAMVEAANKLGYESLQVIELVGKLSDQNAVERSESFKKYADQAELEITVVAEVATEWNVDTAYARMTDTVNMLDNYNAVYIPADTYITPVMSVLQANNRWVESGEEGYVIIASIDGNPSAIEYINDGYVYCTANTDAFDFGRLAIQAAMDLIEGKEVEQMIPVQATALTKEVIAEAGDSIWGNVYAD